VPVASTALPGACQVLIEGAVHGPSAGAAWYGSDEPLDAWWPAALSAWREALECRAARISEPNGRPDAPEMPAEFDAAGARG
jgi:hypothetical protein